MKWRMTDEERKVAIAEAKERRAKLNADFEYERDFRALLAEEKRDKWAAKHKPSMTMVYIDVVLAVFCFATIILAPLGIFFALTAWMKYKMQTKEPEA